MGVLYVDTGGSASNSGSRDANAAALSGSAATVATSTITLDGSPDLSGVNTSGANQDTIYLANANNANQKIFWITAVDNAAKTVTVTGTPTLSASPTAWAIGGRITLAGLTGFESCLRAGDMVTINNTPATAAGPLLTLRTAGTNTGGYVKIKGATGVKPILTATSNQVITGTVGYQWIENLELRNTSATTTHDALVLSGSSADNWVVYDVKISDSPRYGIDIGSGSGITRVVKCEISGCDNHGINARDAASIYLFNYIHDNGQDGVNCASSSGVWVFAYNIIDTNTSQGIAKSSTGTTAFVLLGNTFYNSGDSGFEYTSPSFLTAFNNVFLDNGDAGTEYNIEGYTDADLFELSDYNCLSIAGARGGGNYTGHSLGANSITTDPAMTAPATGDFSLGSSSPAKATGYPGGFPGATSTGYLDMGAIQRQEPVGGGGSGGLITHPGMTGGLH